MKRPQITILIMIFLNLVIVGYNHGKPQKEYNIGISMFSTGIILFLLYKGGFFNN